MHVFFYFLIVILKEKEGKGRPDHGFYGFGGSGVIQIVACSFF